MKRQATKRSAAGAAALREFRAEWQRCYCWMCQRRIGQQVHHIVGRRGVAYDDWRNFAWVCPVCHDRIHHGPQIYRGAELPAWTTLDVLMVKKARQPQWFDLDFLKQLAGRLDYGEGEGL